VPDGALRGADVPAVHHARGPARQG
jgi:hypothetical protein